MLERTIHFLISPSVPIESVFIAMSVRDACAGDVRLAGFLVGGVGHPY